MKHEVTSMNTKKALSASLKKLMEHKKLSKITVSDIVADCKLNRKTFYYHFEDIYALLKWTLKLETTEVLKDFDLLLNPEEAMMYIGDYVDNNRYILNCAYDSMGRDGMRRFFYSDFCGVVSSIIEKLEKDMNKTLPEKFRQHLVDFYTDALAGTLIDYFQNGKKQERDEVIKYTLFILKSSIPNIIKEYK